MSMVHHVERHYGFTVDVPFLSARVIITLHFSALRRSPVIASASSIAVPDAVLPPASVQSC